MPFGQTILDAIDRLKNKYNNGAYNPATNPGGFDQDGHPVNFFPALTDTATVAEGAADKADSANSAAESAAGSAGAAGSARTAAETARDKAQAWASADDGVEVEPGLFSAKVGAAKAKTEADRAQGYAAALNLPPITAADALKYWRVTADGTGTEFVALDTTPSLVRSARTSNTQIVKADQGNLIEITAGTFTQTFASPSDLGDGFFCYVKNGSGDVTIPASDGRNNWIMYPGEMRLFQCDGTTLRSIVLAPFYKEFIASGNFIKPPGYGVFGAILFGGGGGGGKGNGSNLGGQGGRAGSVIIYPSIASSFLASSSGVTVGAAGSGATAVGTSGTAGGGTFVGVLGASGGVGGQTSQAGQSGPDTQGGAESFSSGSGGSYAIGGSASIGQPGSTFGFRGGNSGIAASGEDGTGRSAGGGGTGTGAKGGDGVAGEVRMWGII
ncbi:hypothetical protein U0C82_03670 [Fulvimarina sp. 2208YS6-2-32]|uniref:Tail fiber protein n=1 Tax=Fulvimarina uroteuthidis TaxID=3098149 RepID=A0ABU5HYU7_9HYPH|nr:hypothetical protein [Fulvimarina sp. 2208YS6-2-32]MDY8108247.1 hypothetical protein [Fulvimarina sp. 2208YS6-2-32]